MRHGHHKNWMRATVRAIGPKPRDMAWLDWFNKAMDEGELQYDKQTDQYIVTRVKEASRSFRADMLDAQVGA